MMLTETGTASSAVSEVLNLASLVLDFILAEPYMSALFAGSLIGVACMALRKAKKTAKA